MSLEEEHDVDREQTLPTQDQVPVPQIVTRAASMPSVQSTTIQVASDVLSERRASHQYEHTGVLQPLLPLDQSTPGQSTHGASIYSGLNSPVSPPLGSTRQLRLNASTHSLNSIYSAQSYPSSHIESIGTMSDTASVVGSAAISPMIIEPPPPSQSLQRQPSSGLIPSPTQLSSSSRTLRVRASAIFSKAESSASSISGSSINRRFEDQHLDKTLLKKVRVFLDDKQKIKARFQSLVSFVEASHGMDQASFFQNHPDAVFTVIVSTCESRIHKLKSRTNKPSNFASKDIHELLRPLALFRRILLYLSDLLRTGWRGEEISKLLAPLLDTRNHIRLRLIGFRLLLLWMRSTPEPGTIAAEEIRVLFAKAIPLHVFREEVNALRFVPTRHAAAAQPAMLPMEMFENQDASELLLPSPTPPSAAESLNMLRIALDEMKVLAELAYGGEPFPAEDDELAQLPGQDTVAFCGGIEAAQRAMFYFTNQLNQTYLIKLLPGATVSSGSHRVPDVGFVRCPPSFLKLLIGFLLNCTVMSPFGPRTQQHTCTPPTILMLCKAISAEPLTRAIGAEAVMQALTLRPIDTYHHLVRAALYLATTWIIQPDLNPSTDICGGRVERTEEQKAADEAAGRPAGYITWNRSLSIYMDFLLLPLEPIPEDESQARSALKMHQLALSLVRVMVIANSERLLPDTWRHILKSLLSIQRIIMWGKPSYNSKSNIDSLVGMLVKTIYVAWVRSKLNDPDIWNQLCTAMREHLLWPHVVRQWGKMVVKMTRVIIREVYRLYEYSHDPKSDRLNKPPPRKASLMSSGMPKSEGYVRKRHSANPIAHSEEREDGLFSANQSTSANTMTMSDDEPARIDRKRSNTQNAVSKNRHGLGI
jgi:hypothetical protein